MIWISQPQPGADSADQAAGCCTEPAMDRTAIERRELMRGAAAFGLALPFAGLRPARGAAEAALVDRRVFFDNPDYRSVHISPDGEHIAYLAPLGGVSNLWVAPAADPQSGRPLTHVA